MAKQLTDKVADIITLLSKLIKAGAALDIGRAISQYPHRVGWFAFNRDEQNLTSIRLLDDPLKAIVEITTNAFDAVTERLIRELLGLSPSFDLSVFRNPHEAIRMLIPDEASRRNRVLVNIVPKVGSSTATVRVLDYGCGITPEEAWGTILSLSKGAKVEKLYTIGTWGVGGASAHAFRDDSGYGVIISRAPGSPVWFTVIRFNPGKYKQGYYECLVSEDGSVLRADLPVPKDLPMGIAIPERVSEIQQGTLVMHFGYELGYYSSNHPMSPKSRGSALNTYLFHSPLPFDCDSWTYRDPERAEQKAHLVHGKAREDGKKLSSDLRPIIGMGEHLDKLWHEAESGLVDEKDRSVDFQTEFVPFAMKVEGEAGGDVLVKYSLLSEREKKNFDLILTHPNKVVLVTYNGQVLDSMTVDELHPCLRTDLNYLCGSGKNDLIVELALDHLKREARNSILTSTRAAIQKKTAWNTVLRLVGDYIARDEVLDQLNRGRREANFTAKAEASDSDREGVEYAMQYVRGLLGPGSFLPGGPTRVRHKARKPKAIALNKDKPTEVTFPAKRERESFPLNLLSKNRRWPFWIETNAPNGYGNPAVWVEDPNGKALSSPKVSILQDLNGGRVRICLELKNEVVGDEGSVVAHYDGVPEARLDYRVINEEPAPRHPKRAVKGTGTQKGIPSINFQPIDPSHAQWNRYHLTKEQEPDFSFDVKSGRNGGEIDVYYSDRKFLPYANAIRGLTEGEQAQFDANFRRLLAAQACILYGAHRADQDLTQEVLAERRASAIAMIMASYIELGLMGKKG